MLINRLFSRPVLTLTFCLGTAFGGQSANAATKIYHPCGGSFSSFVDGFKGAARAAGYDAGTVNGFFKGIAQDQKVLSLDRGQGFFKKDFIDFSRAVISQNRMDNGKRLSAKYDSVFARVERDFGVSRGVLLAFWALETDFGQVQGDFNTANALVTLAHDCRRPELFQPQVMSAIELYKRGDFDPATTTGAWAGEIGMVQMLPADILENGVDGDGDGHVSLKTSVADALMSGGKMLADLGWRRGEPWLQEVTVPSNLDWSAAGLHESQSVGDWARAGVKARSGSLGANGLQANLILPMGRNGPAFLAYPNFHVYFEWNQSFVYVTTAAYFATRLEGASIYDPRNPDARLDDGQMKALQQKLAKRGHDVGKIDGILGSGTRDAVRKEQTRLGLPADAWPTLDLLNKL